MATFRNISILPSRRGSNTRLILDLLASFLPDDALRSRKYKGGAYVGRSPVCRAACFLLAAMVMASAHSHESQVPHTHDDHYDVVDLGDITDEITSRNGKTFDFQKNFVNDDDPRVIPIYSFSVNRNIKIEFEYYPTSNFQVSLSWNFDTDCEYRTPHNNILEKNVTYFVTPCIRRSYTPFLNQNQSYRARLWEVPPDPPNLELVLRHESDPLRVPEGTQKSYSVRLNRSPGGQVMVRLKVVDGRPRAVSVSCPNQSAGELSGVAAVDSRDALCLTFNNDNWSMDQTVTVEAIEDDDADSETVDLEHSIWRANERVAEGDSLTVEVVDNDEAHVILSHDGMEIGEAYEVEINEGQRVTYSARLASRPMGDVRVVPQVTSDIDGPPAVTVHPEFLTFTTENRMTEGSLNWMTEGEFTIFAHKDDDSDNEEGIVVTHLVLDYTFIDEEGSRSSVERAPSINVTVIDEDKPHVVLSKPPGGQSWNRQLTIYEEGEGVSSPREGTYNVRLSSRPRNVMRVEVSLESGDGDAVGYSTPISLDFDENNWETGETVTITALSDEDADHEELTFHHTLVDGDDSVDVGTVTVTVMDDDERGVILSKRPDGQSWNRQLTVYEEGEGVSSPREETYNVRLSSRPRNDVTVEVSLESGDGDAVGYSTPISLVFDESNWEAGETVTITAFSDGDADHEELTFRHTVVGGDDDYVDIGRDAGTVTVTVMDGGDRGLVLSYQGDVIGQGQNIVVERSNASYRIRLASEPMGEVIVRPGVRSIQGSSGETVHLTDELTFNRTNWNVWQRVEITVGGHDFDANDMVFKVVHEVTSNADPGYDNFVRDNGEGQVSFSVTVVDEDEIAVDEEKERTFTEVLGRTVAPQIVSQSVHTIGKSRFSSGARSGTSLTLGGHAVRSGKTVSMSSLAPLPADARTDSDLLSGLERGPRTEQWTLSDLLGSSAFQIALGAADDEASGARTAPQWTLWGNGTLQAFANDPDTGSRYDGDMASGFLGADMSWDDRWISGLAISRIRADVDYGLGSDMAKNGRLEVTLNSAHPYLRYAPDEKSELWVVLGRGLGEIEDDDRGRSIRIQENEDLSMWMGAAGGRRVLGSPNAKADVRSEWALLGDLSYVHLEAGESDGVGTELDGKALRSLTADAWGMRFGTEGSYGTKLEGGEILTASMEVALRLDGGDVEDEFGIEVSPAIDFANPEVGLGILARGRALVLHSAESYEEYGASVTANLSPRADGLGLSMSVSPRWGAMARTGMDALWLHGGDPVRSVSTSADRGETALNARVSYGVPAWRGRLAPFGEFDLREEGERRMRVGASFGSTPRSAPGVLRLELSGERHESRDGEPVHRVGLTGRLRF